jgi:hypothetical protein
MGLAMILISKYASSPVVATVSKVSQNTEVKGLQTGYNMLSTSLFEVSIPNTFAQKTSSETPDNSILESYMLAEKYKSGSSQIGITIGKTDSPSLEDVAFVKQRRLESTNYTQVTPESLSEMSALVFVRNDGSETAIFIKSGNKYAALVVSGQTGLKDSYTNIATELIKTWRWL